MSAAENYICKSKMINAIIICNQHSGYNTFHDLLNKCTIINCYVAL